MNSIDGSSMKEKRFFIKIVFLLLLMITSCLVYHNYDTYKSIKVVVSNTAVVEYGDANYNLGKLIKEVDGEVVSIKKDIDTTRLGEQEVIIEVQKDDVIKEVPIVVSVIDSVAPAITLKDEKYVVTEGENFDLNDNIDSVIDSIDGNLNYVDSINDDTKNYYTINYDDDVTNVGTHEITINAVDKSGNVSTQTFVLEVEPKPVYVQPVYNSNVSDVGPSAYGNDVVSIAYSLVGRPYVSGGNGPYSFDCSGFVQYVYSQVGVGLSRSTYTQANDGVSVSYENAQPGDIILWGYSSGSVTHSTLYVGNGTMIHAANPSTGVIISNVAGWLRGSGTHIVAVRRVK